MVRTEEVGLKEIILDSRPGLTLESFIVSTSGQSSVDEATYVA